MANQDVLKFKDYTRLNNHYLKICLTEECLSLIGFNTEILDNNLYQLAITSEEIKKNNRLKKFSLTQLFDKIIELIEKKKYQMTGDKNCIILSIFEGENFDINKDLQFVMVKTNDDQSGTYENGMKRLIKSLRRENTDIKTELEELKLDKKALSEGVNEKFSKTVVKNKKDNILYKKIYPKNNTDIHEEASKKKEDKNANNSEEVNKNYKKKKTFGLTISTLAKLDYDSYPNVELNSTFFNIISGYGGNSYNGIKRDYNEDRIKIISEYKLPKPVKQKNGEMVDPKISYFAIYDGHGGEMCCNFLQENLHKYIFNSKFFPLYTIQAISTAYTEAEKDFSEKVIDPETGKLSDRSGSCAVSALIMDEYCFITNLGDSRALYSYNSGKQLYQVTRDHKPNDPIEKERIEKAGGKVVKGGMMKYNGTLVELVEKSLPAGVIIPYRLVPGNIAVSKY
jgi:hypothetical protein